MLVVLSEEQTASMATYQKFLRQSYYQVILTLSKFNLSSPIQWYGECIRNVQ